MTFDDKETSTHLFKSMIFPEITEEGKVYLRIRTSCAECGLRVKMENIAINDGEDTLVFVDMGSEVMTSPCIAQMDKRLLN